MYVTGRTHGPVYTCELWASSPRCSSRRMWSRGCPLHRQRRSWGVLVAVNPVANGIVVALTGMTVPEGSPERVRAEIVDPHLVLVRFLTGLEGAVSDVAGATASGARGEAIVAYMRAISQFSSGDGADYLKGLKETALQLADAGNEFAYQLEYTNMMIVEQVVLFFAELAVIALLEIFNPVQAAFEKLALDTFFRELFTTELTQFLARVAAQTASIMTMNVVLAAALDGFTRWVMATQGKHTAHGNEYRDQSLKFGAIQGAVSSLVPFAMGPIGKGIGKLPFFGLKSVKDIRQIIGESLHGPAPVPARTGTKTTLPVGSGNTLLGGEKTALGGEKALLGGEKALLGGGKSFDRNAMRDLWNDPLNRELLGGNWFGREIGRLTVPIAVRLQNEVVGRGARQSFRDAVGDQFARAFGERLGWRQARESGRLWADTFMAHAGRGPRALGRELEGTLSWMPAGMGGVRGALSHDLARALPSPSWMKFVRAFPEAGLQAAAMNVSEGFFNLNETGRFTTSWMTTAGGVGAALGSGIGHIGAVKLGHWIKGRLGFDLPHHKPPLTDPGLALVNKAGGHGPAGSSDSSVLPGDGAPPPGNVLPTTGAGTPSDTSWSPSPGTQFPRSGQVRLTIPERLTVGHTAPGAERAGDGRPAPFTPAPRPATESATTRPVLGSPERARLEEALDRWQTPEELTRHDNDDTDRARLLLERTAAADQIIQHLRQLADQADITLAGQRHLLTAADEAAARRDWPQTATYLSTIRDHIRIPLSTRLHPSTPTPAPRPGIPATPAPDHVHTHSRSEHEADAPTAVEWTHTTAQPAAEQPTITLVRFEAGRGSEHWAPTAPGALPLPGETAQAMRTAPPHPTTSSSGPPYKTSTAPTSPASTDPRAAVGREEPSWLSVRSVIDPAPAPRPFDESPGQTQQDPQAAAQTIYRILAEGRPPQKPAPGDKEERRAGEADIPKTGTRARPENLRLLFPAEAVYLNKHLDRHFTRNDGRAPGPEQPVRVGTRAAVSTEDSRVPSRRTAAPRNDSEAASVRPVAEKPAGSGPLQQDMRARDGLFTGQRLPRGRAEIAAWIAHLPPPKPPLDVQVFMINRITPALAEGGTAAPYVIPAHEISSLPPQTAERVALLNEYYATHPQRIGPRPARTGSSPNLLEKRYNSLLTLLSRAGVELGDLHLLRAFTRFGIRMERGLDGSGRTRYFPADPLAYGEMRASYDRGMQPRGQLPRAARFQKVITRLVDEGLIAQRGDRSLLPAVRALIEAGFSWELRGSDRGRVYLALPQSERITQLRQYAGAVGLPAGALPPYLTGPGRVEGLAARVGDFFHHLLHTGIPEHQRDLTEWLDRHGFSLTRVVTGRGVVLRLPAPAPEQSGPGPHTVDELLTSLFGDWRGEDIFQEPAADTAPAPRPDSRTERDGGRDTGTAAQPVPPPATGTDRDMDVDTPPSAPLTRTAFPPAADAAQVAPLRAAPYVVPPGDRLPRATREYIDTLNAYYTRFPDRHGQQPPPLTVDEAAGTERHLEAEAGDLFAKLRALSINPSNAHLIAALQRFGIRLLPGRDQQGRDRYFLEPAISQDVLRAWFDGAGGTHGEMPPHSGPHRNAYTRINTLIAHGLAVRQANLPSFRDMIRWGFSWELRGGSSARLYLALPETRRLAQLERFVRAQTLLPGVVPEYRTDPDREEGPAAQAGDFFHHLQYTGIPERQVRLTAWLADHGFVLRPDPAATGIMRLPVAGDLIEPGTLSVGGLLASRFANWHDDAALPTSQETGAPTAQRLVPPVPVAGDENADPDGETQPTSPSRPAGTPATRPAAPAPVATELTRSNRRPPPDPAETATAAPTAQGLQDFAVRPYTVSPGEPVRRSTLRRIAVLNAYYTSPLGKIGRQPPRINDPVGIDQRQVDAAYLLQRLRHRGIAPDDHHLIAALEGFGVEVVPGQDSAGYERLFVTTVHSQEMLRRYFEDEGGTPGLVPTGSEQVNVASRLRSLMKNGLLAARSNFSTFNALETWGFFWELRSSEPSRVFLASEHERLTELDEYAAEVGLEPGVVPPRSTGPQRTGDLAARVGEFFHHLQYTGISETHTVLAGRLAEEGFALAPVEVRPGLVMLRLPVPEAERDPAAESVHNFIDRVAWGGRVHQPPRSAQPSTRSAVTGTGERGTAEPMAPARIQDAVEPFGIAVGWVGQTLQTVDAQLLGEAVPGLTREERQELPDVMDAMFVSSASAGEMTQYLAEIVRSARAVNGLRAEQGAGPVTITDVARVMASNSPEHRDEQLALAFLAAPSTRGAESSYEGGPVSASATGNTGAPQRMPWTVADDTPLPSAPGMAEVRRIVADRLLVGDVRGDGDCLFNSFIITTGLHVRADQPTRSATALREDLARYLEEQLDAPDSVWDTLEPRLRELGGGAVTPEHQRSLLDFIRTPGAWSIGLGNFLPELLARMHGVRVEVLDYSRTRAQPLSSYHLEPAHWSRTVSLVRLDSGPGTEHWAPTAPAGAPLPAGTPVTMWGPASPTPAVGTHHAGRPAATRTRSTDVPEPETADTSGARPAGGSPAGSTRASSPMDSLFDESDTRDLVAQSPVPSPSGLALPGSSASVRLSDTGPGASRPPVTGISATGRTDTGPTPETAPREHSVLNVDNHINLPTPRAVHHLGDVASVSWHKRPAPSAFPFTRSESAHLAPEQATQLFHLLSDRMDHRDTLGGVWDHIEATYRLTLGPGELLRLNDEYHWLSERAPRPQGRRRAPAPQTAFRPYDVSDVSLTSTTRRRVELLNDFYRAHPHMIGRRPRFGSYSAAAAPPLVRRMHNLLETLDRRGINPDDTHLIAAWQSFGVPLAEATLGGRPVLKIARAPLSHHLLPPAGQCEWQGAVPSTSFGGKDLHNYVQRLMRRGILLRAVNTPTISALAERGFTWEQRGSDPSRVYLALPERERIEQLKRYADEVGFEPGVVPPFSSGPERVEGLRARVGDFFRHLQNTGIPENHTELAQWLADAGFPLIPVEPAPGVVMMRLPVPGGTGEPLHAYIARVLGANRERVPGRSTRAGEPAARQEASAARPSSRTAGQAAVAAVGHPPVADNGPLHPGQDLPLPGDQVLFPDGVLSLPDSQDSSDVFMDFGGYLGHDIADGLPMDVEEMVSALTGMFADTSEAGRPWPVDPEDAAMDFMDTGAPQETTALTDTWENRVIQATEEQLRSSDVPLTWEERTELPWALLTVSDVSEATGAAVQHMVTLVEATRAVNDVLNAQGRFRVSVREVAWSTAGVPPGAWSEHLTASFLAAHGQPDTSADLRME
ncbi:hypothetical protein [Streptomyces sp. NPDC056160]|uniref:hypothetical protein n=1 Tax=Streptomyces sp. NPDC056160 TaxID=3345731 RepID=UPI0035DABFCF